MPTVASRSSTASWRALSSVLSVVAEIDRTPQNPFQDTPFLFCSSFLFVVLHYYLSLRRSKFFGIYTIGSFVLLLAHCRLICDASSDAIACQRDELLLVFLCSALILEGRVSDAVPPCKFEVCQQIQQWRCCPHFNIF